MIVRYIHHEAPEESRYYNVENAWRNTPAALGGAGNLTLGQFGTRELAKFEDDLKKGIVLSYEVCRTDDFYVTVRYLESDDLNDTDIIRFTIPEPVNAGMIPFTGAALCNAIDDAMETIDRDECDGILEYLDEVFDAVAERMHGSWKWVETTKYIEV